MALYKVGETSLTRVVATTFAREQILERQDLQRLLRANVAVLDEDVLLVSEEFGSFTDAHRRIDLLGIDKAGHLVVFELKRTTDGGHLELQALRYAAMVSTMTFDALVGHYRFFLENTDLGDPDQARETLADHLAAVGGEDAVLSREVRIVLVSAGFDREITTTVLWLNDVFGLDIRCVRLLPYRVDGQLILDVQQIIPLPEARDLIIKLRQRESQARVAREGGADWTAYAVTTPDGDSGPLRKRRAVLYLATALAAAGVDPARMQQLLGRRLISVPGHLTGDALSKGVCEANPTLNPSELGRWFLDQPLPGDGCTWVLSKMWGMDTEDALDGLLSLVPPGGGYGYQALRD